MSFVCGGRRLKAMESSSIHAFFVADDRTPNVLDLKSGVNSMSSWPLHEQLFFADDQIEFFIADNQMSNVVDLKYSSNAIYFFLHHALSVGSGYGMLDSLERYQIMSSGALVLVISEHVSTGADFKQY
ncbi:hypothetical protein MUK42_15171 [Musa troglodytarum]|uniref:Uncharacterized protein n=1 Tax=Musa troglodytarum TaxID=320322 RepID=A0A9E7I927_9LILI|nr:hypothetical protein MUK42_15171 [Musa troglodytarum]